MNNLAGLSSECNEMSTIPFNSSLLAIFLSCAFGSPVLAQYSGFGRGGVGYGHFVGPQPGFYPGQGGLSISIGTGLGYVGYGSRGLGGWGYGGLGYSGFAMGSPFASGYGFPYDAVGFHYDGYGGLGYLDDRSALRGYRGYASGYQGYHADVPSYVPRDFLPPIGYLPYAAQGQSFGVPGYESEFRHRVDPYANDRAALYGASKRPIEEPMLDQPMDPSSPDLRPGSLLPDGSRVISIGPISSSPAQQQAVPQDMSDLSTPNFTSRPESALEEREVTDETSETADAQMNGSVELLPAPAAVQQNGKVEL
jgi:hypothetical protein